MTIESVGSKLLSEIARMSAKRERWRDIAKRTASEKAYSYAIRSMLRDCAMAQEALDDDDPVRCITALQALEGYSDDD